ncbi:MAG: TonB-dependent receptor [Chitinophagia bacterium]|nr:TonB-dependent receptor [Chitinophagia bacterium]
MKHPFLFALVLLFFYGAMAQTDTLVQKDLEEAIVYSSKFEEKKKNLAQFIDVITAKTIACYNAQNMGDLLINTGQLFVQKSQQGGSSPVIRGFEASRVLLVVDGIRLNNAIYRSGHLQNVITVDQFMLERVEVLYGPGSTLYGSDALGGVVHMRTRTPKLSQTDTTLFRSQLVTRYSTANKENTIHSSQEISGKKWAWLQSITYSDFGDLRMGNRYPKKYPDFGRRTHYIETVNGVDQLVPNADDRIQKFSGYKQWDILGKLLFKPNEQQTHTLNLQHSNSSDVPRYDRLQDVKNFTGIGTTLRWAQWYYGPQTRWLAAYEYGVKNFKQIDELRLTLNYQHIKESRYQREYQAYTRFDSRREAVQVAGVILDAREKWGRHELTLGADAQHNIVRSRADRTNLLTGAITPLDTRYPDGRNRMTLVGLYGQHLYKSHNGKWIINDGLRLQYVQLHSTIINNSFFNFPFTAIDQQQQALIGNFGIVHLPATRIRVAANLASAFRAPNVDDAARIFESSTTARRLIVPNPQLNPEYTYTGDVHFQYRTEKVKLELSGFYTLFRNAIALAPFQLNGQDSVLYNGIMSRVIANQNIRRAFVRGFNYRLHIALGKGLNWETTVTTTYGRFINPDKTLKPLDHIPPTFGRTSLLYQKGGLTWEFFMLFNGTKHLADFNPDGEDNGQYATPDGMPSWYTLNIRTEYRLSKGLTLQAGIENLLDRNYRYFASGFSAPGRNLFVAIRQNF